MTRYSLSFVCASNSDAILEGNLLASPCIRQGCDLYVERGAASAAEAYNRGLETTSGDIVIFVHQDVYLPEGWDALLHHRLEELDRIDPDWGLAGAYGVAPDGQGYGPVWSSSLSHIVGRVGLGPQEIHSLDEMLIIMRRDCALRFNAQIDGWHMYGTDIICRAREVGHKSYALALPCIHNDRFHGALGTDFDQCYRQMQRFWPQFLPLRTSVIKLTRWGLPLLKSRLHMRKSYQQRENLSVGTDFPPALLAARCGWQSLAPQLVAESDDTAGLSSWPLASACAYRSHVPAA